MVWWLLGYRQTHSMLGIPYRHATQQLHNHRFGGAHRRRVERFGGVGGGWFLSFDTRRAQTHHHQHHSASLLSSAEWRLFVGDAATGGGGSHPLVLQRTSHSGWTFGAKLMGALASFVLLAGVISTILTLNSSVQVDAYRPVILTILGILLIIIGPMIACRLILNAYDRRLLREQRQFETFARRFRSRQENGGDGLRRNGTANPSTTPSRAQMAVGYLLGATGLRSQNAAAIEICDPEDLFPGKLPSYDSAMDLKRTSNQHWATKFFSKDSPPPCYRETLTGNRWPRTRSVGSLAPSLNGCEEIVSDQATMTVAPTDEQVVPTSTVRQPPMIATIEQTITHPPPLLPSTSASTLASPLPRTCSLPSVLMATTDEV